MLIPGTREGWLLCLPLESGDDVAGLFELLGLAYRKQEWKSYRKNIAQSNGTFKQK